MGVMRGRLQECMMRAFGRTVTKVAEVDMSKMLKEAKLFEHFPESTWPEYCTGS